MERSVIRNRIDQLDALPVHPHVLSAALAAVQPGRYDVDRLASIVYSDPGLAALTLRAVYQDRFHSTVDLPESTQVVTELGRGRMQALLLRLAMPAAFDQPHVPSPRLDALWRDALWAGHGARMVAERLGEPLPHEAYAVGLLHDIGRLAEYALVNDDTESSDEFDEELGEDFDHTRAGKWLAERWRLPGRIAEAAWLHHQPLDFLGGTRYPIRLFEVIALADALRPHPVRPASHEYLDRRALSMLGRLGWTQREGEAIREATEKAVRQAIAAVEPGDDLHAGLRETVRRMVLETVERQGQSDTTVADARRQVQRFRAIQTMLSRLRPGQSLGDLLDVFSQTAREDLGIAPGVCCVLEREGRSLLLRSWQTEDESGRRSSVDFQTGDAAGNVGPPGQIAQALQTLGLGGGAAGWAGAALNDVIRWQGLVAAPMLAGGECYGQLLFDAAACDFELTEEAFEELMAFTAACGLAVFRRRAEEQLESQAEELALGMRAGEPVSERHEDSARLSRLGEYAAGAAQAMNAPLNLATAQLQWFANKAADVRDRDVLEGIVRHTASARRAAKDLLFLVRPTAPRTVPCLVNYVLHQIVENSRPILGEKGIRFVERYADGLPRVLMDRRQMEHALSSLIEFALESMSETGGTLTFQTWASPNRASVVIHIADTGHGLTPEELNELFEPIAMVRNQPRNTGLALTVARDIAIRHDGLLEVESNSDAGTAFTITLPAAAVRPDLPVEPEPAIAPAAPPPIVMLVADDDPKVRQALDATLSEQGYQVITAANGVQAMKVLDAESVDLVLLDMGMPVMDGHAVLDALRHREPRIPVIGMTGSGDPDDREEALRQGARACLQKPFQLRHILEEVEAALAIHQVPG